MDKTNKKAPVKSVNRDSLIEQLKSLGGGIGASIKSDVVSGIGNDALSSLFNTPKQGDMTPGKPVNLNTPPSQEMPEDLPFMPRRRPEMFIDPISRETINRLKEQESMVSQRIEEIRIELKALISAVKNVNQEIETAVTSNMIDPGAYHLAFLDRLKSILKIMRKNLNSSATWLNALKSRKKERKYWNMYKKKGTSFGLSNERSVSTQVG